LFFNRNQKFNYFTRIIHKKSLNILKVNKYII
jgi:hypothetical protein